MKNYRAQFLISAADASGFPPVSLPEVAIVGKSNVGKSSLINALVGINKLARTSNTPGRTRLINWFELLDEPRMYLVDLPGYGFAKVSKEMRKSWQPLIESYLKDRASLCGVILLLDSRRDVSREDAELADWFTQMNVPCRIVLTKIDKLPKSKRKLVAMEIAKKLDFKRKILATSAESREGLDTLWNILRAMTGA